MRNSVDGGAVGEKERSGHFVAASTTIGSLLAGCYNITISLCFSVTLSQYRGVFLLEYHNIVMFPCYRYMICYNWFTTSRMLHYRNIVMFFSYNITVMSCFSVTISQCRHAFCYNIVMFPCDRYMTYYNWFTAIRMLQYNITMSPCFSVKICNCVIYKCFQLHMMT